MSLAGEVGLAALGLALAASVYAAAASGYGRLRDKPEWIESARRALLSIWPLLSLALAGLITLLLTGHFEYRYVGAVSERSLPDFLKVTALWGGQAGSLLFWSWLMSGFAGAVAMRRWDRDRDYLPGVILVCAVTLAFFLGMTTLVENPFARWWELADGAQIASIFQPLGSLPLFPVDGRGLNPLLRHPGMIIHPPMLYLGFVSFVIPYAFAMAALISGRNDDRWVRLARRWALVGWLLLSLGLLLGGRWAYDVLGWGGYWGWDPVEIAALMPWLSGTAFLHSVMVEEKRGLLKRWNTVLVVLTYCLVVFGTFLTRSGVLSSVHAFAQSAIGPLFFGYIALAFLASLGLVMWRWAEWKTEQEFGPVLSRESLFLFNNLLFLGILVVCFWGVVYPLLSEVATGQKVTVGPAFYERATAPLWLALLLLMGVAPLTAYGRSSARALGRLLRLPVALAAAVVGALIVSGVQHPGALLGGGLAAFVAFVTLAEFWRGAAARRLRHDESWGRALLALIARNRRRYGGYFVHLGVVLMAIGIIGVELFQAETQGTIAQGESLRLGRYRMVYESLSEFDTADGRNVARAVVGVYRDDRRVGTLAPRRDYFIQTQQPMTIPGLRSSIEGDFYVLLVGWKPIAAEGATFKIYWNPLINFLWAGGLVFLFGTLVAAWPESEMEAAAIQLLGRAAAGVSSP